MTRAKRPAAGKRARARRSPSPPPSARPAAAELALLEMARTITKLATTEASPRAAVTRAIQALTAAFHADAPLPGTLATARIAGRRDKTRALALAWAREQLRLSLGEVLARAATAGELGVALPPESLAWFALAACEALADEPPQAAPDRIRILLQWLVGARAGG